MRIIAGKLKGRRLYAPADDKVRPTYDKVKEALFSMLTGYIDEDTIAADLFAGSGNLGLEAISRGAAFVYFGDKSKNSLALTKKNIAHCEVAGQAKVIPGDYRDVLEKIPEPVDLFFLDPPYHDGFIEECVLKIKELNLLKPEGLIVAEHDAKDTYPDQLCGYEKIKEKRYGNIGVTVFLNTQEEIV